MEIIKSLQAGLIRQEEFRCFGKILTAVIINCTAITVVLRFGIQTSKTRIVIGCNIITDIAVVQLGCTTTHARAI